MPSRRGVWRAARTFALDLTPLRVSRDFRFLFLGEAAGVAGDQVRLVAIPYLVYSVTHSSLMVGLVSLAQFLPTLLLALAGGALADTMDRRRLLVITQSLLFALALLLALPALSGRFPLWYIFIVVALAAGIQSVDGPTRRAAMPRLVGLDQVSNALALDQMTFQLGGVLGPVLAGVLLARFGVGPTLLFNAAAAGVSLLLIQFVAPLPPEPGAAGGKRGIAAMREGFVYLKGQPVILSTFLVDLNAMFFGSPQALMPALATQVFRTGPAGLGLLYAAPGAGAFLGTLMTGWVRRVRHQGRAVVIAVCVWGVAVALFGAVTRFFWLGLLLLAISGAADMFSAVFRSTILQVATPDRLRGRLSAVHFLVVSSGPRLGDVEAGAVATLTTTRFSVVSGGVAAIVGALVLGLAIPTFIRYDAELERDRPRDS